MGEKGNELMRTQLKSDKTGQSVTPGRRPKQEERVILIYVTRAMNSIYKRGYQKL